MQKNIALLVMMVSFVLLTACHHHQPDHRPHNKSEHREPPGSGHPPSHEQRPVVPERI